MDTLVLNRRQVRSVDRRAIEEYGMLGLVLMENAGRVCVHVLRQLGDVGRVVVACGKGNNGGDGFVIARHLDNQRIPVKVLLCCREDELTGDAAANFHILKHTSVPILPACDQRQIDACAAELAPADWIVDALLGTGASGEPRSPYAELLPLLNAAPGRKLAVDLPSGLDCDTGECSANTFRADHTCTFVAPKPGLLLPRNRPFVGQLHAIDIGVPRLLIERIAAEG